MLNNTQKLISHIRAFLLIQGEACAIGSACLYRKEDKRCAFGCIIPDEYYNRFMENQSSDSILKNYPKLTEYLKNHWGIESSLHLTNVIDKCQTVHDLEAGAGLSKEELRGIWQRKYTALIESYADK